MTEPKLLNEVNNVARLKRISQGEKLGTHYSPDLNPISTSDCASRKRCDTLKVRPLTPLRRRGVKPADENMPHMQ